MAKNVAVSSAKTDTSSSTSAKRPRKLLVEAARLNVRARSGRTLVERTALVSRVLDEIQRRRVVCIMADAGMGKTVLANQVARELEDQGVTALYASVKGLDGDEALSRLVRCVRSIEARSGRDRLALVIDDIPAWDEQQAHRAARFLGRLAITDARVLIMGRTSSSALLDELTDPVAMWSSDLLLGERDVELWCPAWKEQPAELMEVTGGIPLLVDTLRSAVPTDDERRLPSSYGRHLADLVRECMGDQAMDEERRLRFAMISTGAGRVSELSVVSDHIEAAVVEDLSMGCPLLRVSAEHDTYSVVGARRDEPLRALATDSHMDEQETADLCARIVVVLAKNDSFDRMGLVCRNLFTKEQVGEVVCTWPVELANAGYPDLLLQARQYEKDERRGFGARMALRARAALAGDESLSRELRALPTRAMTDRQREIAKQVEALEFALGAADAPQDPGAGQLCSDLILHGSLSGLLKEGKLSAAYRDLLVADDRTSGSTLVASLLRLDKELVCILVGDSVSAGKTAEYDEAYEFLDSRGFPELYAQMGAKRAISAVANGEALDERMLARAQSFSMRKADKTTEALALIAAAGHDIRHESHKRACVRADLAVQRAEECGSPYLAVIATLLREYAAARLEHGFGGTCEFAGIIEDATPEQAAVWVIRQSLGGLCDSGKVRMTLSDVQTPSGVMPLAAFVLGEGGEIGAALESRMPPTWIAHARRIRCSKSDRELSQQRVLVSAGGRVLRPSTRIEAYAMGTLRVVVDGEELSRTAWDRTASRHLFVLLICAEGHEVPVKDAIAELWPDCDFIAGKRRLYPTISSLRSCLDTGENEECDSIIRRSNGRIILDTTDIYIDLDDFEREARMAVIATQTASCVRHAVAANRLYRGGLVHGFARGGGLLQSRANKLRSLYVDAMVAAAEAELRSGVSRRATWFAREAMDANNMREDAVAVSLRSLHAASRINEAVRLYDAYLRRAAEKGGRLATTYIDGVVRELGLFSRASSTSTSGTMPA